jgi:hypothetical protein
MGFGSRSWVNVSFIPLFPYLPDFAFGSYNDGGGQRPVEISHTASDRSLLFSSISMSSPQDPTCIIIYK